MINILITGGAGDWAVSFKEKYKNQFNITTTSHTELDVTSSDRVVAFFQNQAVEGKKFDVVINNAGCIHPKRILEADSQAWINDINVNLIGTFLVSKSALGANKETIIINISSTAAFNSYPDWSSYCASKAGVVTLSKSLSKDGFQVYCLCPGAIDTKFRDNLNLSNDNAMACDDVSVHIIDILANKYTSGDVLFFRKGEFILNP
ncbi:MAG: SDR family oxidoreductase [Alteromonadaceae bacterium]|nr:SDR family oxidoreductase [Alteromonadaceae bacterium]